jgi:hypothetical protein
VAMRNIEIKVLCKADFSKWSFIEMSDYRSRFFGAGAVIVCWAHEAAAVAFSLALGCAQDCLPAQYVLRIIFRFRERGYAQARADPFS